MKCTSRTRAFAADHIRQTGNTADVPHFTEWSEAKTSIYLRDEKIIREEARMNVRGV